VALVTDREYEPTLSVRLRQKYEDRLSTRANQRERGLISSLKIFAGGVSNLAETGLFFWVLPILQWVEIWDL
jgi:hypothetical protein